MGYFPNATAWDFWAPSNCFKCGHWPKTEDDAPCPVEMAHMLYNYQQGDAGEDCPVRTMLDMLIPRKGIENQRCAMFKDRDGLSARHLRDWEKYKAVMAERDAAQVGRNPEGGDPQGLRAEHEHAVAEGDAPNPFSPSPSTPEIPQ